MKRVLACVVVAILMASGAIACEREQRRWTDIAPLSSRPGTLSSSPRPVSFAGTDPFEKNAYAVSQGKQLFQWYNCSGCHFNGGGGMGPPLMDNKWIYGDSPQAIYTTIVDGRPNGMPAFGKRIPEQQVWQLVAYVRSMSGLLRKDVRPGRSDHMTVRQAESSTTPASDNSNAPGASQPAK